MFSKFFSSCLLLLQLLLPGTQACSYSCGPDEKACLDNVWGTVAADCSGFLGCVNMTQPCAGECPPDYPVMSADGLSCHQCQEDGGDGGEELCPQCKEGELWCRAEKACKPRTSLCSGKCPSLLHPVMTTQACFPCPEYSSWCEEEGRCFDPESEPCNAQCHTLGLHYCQDENTCIEEGVTCGGELGVQRLPAIEEPTKDLALPYTGPLQPQYFFLVPSFVLVNPVPQLNAAQGVSMDTNAAVLQITYGKTRNAENEKKTPNYPGIMGFGFFQIPLWNLGVPIVKEPVDIKV